MSTPTLLSPSYNGARMAVITPRPMTFHLAAERYGTACCSARCYLISHTAPSRLGTDRCLN
jgi:hypothetical protein